MLTRRQQIGQRVKDRREELGLTQVQLAGMVGVTQGAVSQWEAGSGDVKEHNIDALARALQVTPEFIRYGVIAQELPLEPASEDVERRGKPDGSPGRKRRVKGA